MNMIKATGLALALVLSPAAGHSIEILKTENASLDLGAHFQLLGALQNVTSVNTFPTNNPGPRNPTRIYLFQAQNRLKLSGDFDGVTFRFEQAMGGEDYNGSNNALNMLQFNATVPLTERLNLTLGQFKIPTNLASATDDTTLLFTVRSPLLNLFFNHGYDTGLIFSTRGEGWNALFGTVAGAPSLPQRYLPMLFEVPPMLVTRVGIGNLPDDPFKPSQEVQAKPEESQWGLHFNGQFVNDTKAGHSSLLGQQTGQMNVGYNGNYGNVILNSNWNPYLGKSVFSNGRIEAHYWTASVDAVYRRPLESSTLILQAQWSYAEYANRAWRQNNAVNAPVNNPANPQLANEIRVQGGELMAAVQGEKWSLATRVNVILPDPAFGKFLGTTPNQTILSFLGSDPIYEITLPAITYRMSRHVKVVADAMAWLNAPQALGDSGVYQLIDTPGQVSGVTAANPVVPSQFVSMGRMMFQFEF